jgi:spheroidene monooxygenase
MARPPEVAVLLLAHVAPGDRAWLFSRLVRGARGLARVPGLRFARVLGSGHEGGFGLRPSFEHGGVFALFDDEPSAERFINESAPVQAYRQRSAEFLVAMLRATSVRGSWGGQTMVPSTWPQPGGPVASLTRASIRPRRALAFWRHAAPAQAALAGAEGCQLLAGLGEAPLFRQATFSLWRNAAAMDAYARQGAHQAAIREAYQQGYFTETMFVRFVPLLLRGCWQGRTHDLRQAPAPRPQGELEAANA